MDEHDRRILVGRRKTDPIAEKLIRILNDRLDLQNDEVLRDFVEALEWLVELKRKKEEASNKLFSAILQASLLLLGYALLNGFLTTLKHKLGL